MILGLLDRALTACGMATVERCASAEFGPTPGAQLVLVGYSGKQLAAMSEGELAAAYREAYRELHAPVRAHAMRG